jgi:TM2 domain-containing membrane protein YozV
MYCHNCGKQLPDGTRFCPDCGAANAPTAGAPPAAPPPVTGIPVAQEAASPKSRLVATLLAFFVGRLGVHRFYIGKTGSGIAILLLTVIGAIITVTAGTYTASSDLGFFGFFSWGTPDWGTFGPLWRNITGLATFGSVLMAAGSIWGFVDFIIIVIGHMKDTAGRRIRDWKA